MIFFTKTCKRDVARVLYQIRAMRRFYPDFTHVVAIEKADIGLLEAEHGEGGTRIVAVEKTFGPIPIVNPYLAQQAYKLLAPLVFEDDTFQLDSDMCPFRREGSVVLAAAELPRWYMKPAQDLTYIRKWAVLYERIFGCEPSLPRMHMMMSQHGWHVCEDVARAFLVTLCKRMGALEPDARYSMGRALSMVVGHQPFSEYQLFGWWAYENVREAYRWVRGPQPKWLHHFTSRDQLDGKAKQLLREAAGL